MIILIIFIGSALQKIFDYFINLTPMLFGAILSYFLVFEFLALGEGAKDFFSESEDSEDSLGPEASFGIIAAAVVLGIIAGAKLSSGMIYLLSAFMASYCMVRGVSFWAGKFTSEVDVMRGLFTDDDVPPQSPMMLIYSLAIFIIWFFLICVAVCGKSEKAPLREVELERHGAAGYAEQKNEK